MKIRELVLFALICNPLVVFGQLIPTDRRIDWAAGVRGGIPTRTTLINVRNAPYNATGNGVTDDRAAIQRAIDAAREGEVVFLPPGTYVVGDTLRIVNKNNVTLRGAGPKENHHPPQWFPGDPYHLG
jgi:Pectate lyase superfamily protein